MTEPTRKVPRVRPAFLKWSVAAFVLILPFVAHSFWFYYEERQLAAAIQEIERRGEPTKLQDPHLDADSALSERYYRAAGVLASGFRLDTQPSLKMAVGTTQRDEWPSDIAPLRSAVRTYADSLLFADRAASLAFHGFSIGTNYPLLMSDLISVQRLSGYRAIVFAVDGNSNEAISSLTTEVRLDGPLQRYVYTLLRVSDAVHVLEGTRASSAELARLGAAFDGLDDDRELATWFQELRRVRLTRPRDSFGPPRLGERALATALFFERPLIAHWLNKELPVYAELIDAAKAPWPDRIDRTSAVHAEDIFWTGGQDEGTIRRAQNSLQGQVMAHASKVAVFRSLRAAVAVEQYRREHGEQAPKALAELAPAYVRAIPIDPFSGKALLMKEDSDGYSVYSVGANRKDDGGTDLNKPFVPFPTNPLVDMGVRVQYRSTK